MKRKILFAILIVGIIIFLNDLRTRNSSETDYYFQTYFYQKGDYKFIKKTKEFLNEVKKIGFEKNIVRQGEYSVVMNLTEKELKQIVNAKKIRPYFDSYGKTEDMGPPMQCLPTGCTNSY